MNDAWSPLRAELDRWPEGHAPARFWLRDDDAVEPTAALDRLFSLTAGMPAALAVVPQPSGWPLADALQDSPDIAVVAHGWAHTNHASGSEKKQEFGAHRPFGTILAELKAGREKLQELHGHRFLPVFVPPWNRIDPAVAELLPMAGYGAVSTFGDRRFGAVPTVNSSVDIMDWHGSRTGRDHTTVTAEIIRQLRGIARTGTGAVGILTHHLVHDETAWRFLSCLRATIRDHPNCRWCGLAEFL